MMQAVKIDTFSETQIQKMGIKALTERLGVVGTLKFLRQFDNGGVGDYTREKYNSEDEKVTSVDKIMEMFQKES